MALSEGVHQVETIALLGVGDNFAVNLKFVFYCWRNLQRLNADDDNTLPRGIQVGVQRCRQRMRCLFS